MYDRRHALLLCGLERLGNKKWKEVGQIVIKNTENPKAQVKEELDLRGVICPYNFVKTKLKLESMLSGEVLAVMLDEGEPIRNVPQSIRNEGHEVLRQEPIEGAFRIFIKKTS